jgi:hypothetical protein
LSERVNDRLGAVAIKPASLEAHFSADDTAQIETRLAEFEIMLNKWHRETVAALDGEQTIVDLFG